MTIHVSRYASAVSTYQYISANNILLMKLLLMSVVLLLGSVSYDGVTTGCNAVMAVIGLYVIWQGIPYINGTLLRVTVNRLYRSSVQQNSHRL